MKEDIQQIKILAYAIFFIVCFLLGATMASCSLEDDPKPQESCEVLEWKLDAAQKAIIDHQAKGSQGNPEAWKAELSRLTTQRNKIQSEYNVRRCQ